MSEKEIEGSVKDMAGSLFDGYQDTQKELLIIETKKTRNKIFTIAAVVFGFDLVGLLALGRPLSADTLLIISVIPLIFIGLGLLATKEPMAGMVITIFIMLALWIYVISLYGAKGAITGWLAKAIIIYLSIAGFQSAKEAQRIKKELQT